MERQILALLLLGLLFVGYLLGRAAESLIKRLVKAIFEEKKKTYGAFPQYKGFLFLFILLNVVAVSAYYPGETLYFEHNFNNSNLVYTIIDNSSIVRPIITFNVTTISLTLPADTPPSSFTLVFLEEQTREVVREIRVSGGGGGGSSKTITKIVNQTIEVPVEKIVEKPVEITQWNTSTEFKDNFITKKSDYIAYIMLVILLLITFALIRRNRQLKDMVKGGIQ